MTATADPPDWVSARNKEILRQRRPRSKNVFAGSATWHDATAAGIPVLRLSVSPAAAEAPPQSFAVLEKLDWRATNQPPNLPHQLEWQQSKSGRFDFFFCLSSGIGCFGLGERFSGLNLRSKVHTLCSTDNPRHNEGADPLYKSIPVLILGKGERYSAFFVDSPATQRWDLDADLSETAVVELFTRRGWQLYVIGEGSLPQVVAAFTELTGRHPLPPLWSLGHQQCRWSYPDEDTIRYIGQQFRERKIPCDTLVLDIDYMDEYRVFTYSKERFPNFPKLARELAAQSFKLITIVDPGIKEDKHYEPYQESISRKLICYTASGKPFVEKVWPGDCVFPDFLQAETRQWWGEKHEFYVRNGIAGIWNDMNEPAFFEVRDVMPKNFEQAPTKEEDRFTQNSPEGRVAHLEVRNLYGSLMSRATYEGLLKLRPNQRPFVLTRSGYAGVQRYAAVWLGDNMSWFEHLRKSIPMMLNIGLSGVPFAGCDIGGFGGSSDAELLVRWYQLGIFYPFFRNHSALDGCAQEPWAFGAEAERCCRKMIETRYRLLPYIVTLMWEHLRTGAPLMRPLIWHYPNDEIAADIDDQFMFGRDILVAPITERGHSRRNVYLPQGKWYPFDGGEPLEGGRLHSIVTPLDVVPAFVRDGAILPLADPMQSTQEYSATPIVLTAFGEPAHCTLIVDDGSTFDYRQGKYLELQCDFADGGIEIKCIHNGHEINQPLFLTTVSDKSRSPIRWKP